MSTEKPSSVANGRRALSRAELGLLADDIAAQLADPLADLTDRERTRWEGALSVLEVALGRRPSLVRPDIATDIQSLL